MATTKSFNSVVVLATFRSTRNGDFFAIQDGAMFSLNKYTFDQFAAGNYSEIVYDVTDQKLPPSNDPNGNPRAELWQTAVKEVKTTERVLTLKNIDTEQLNYQLAEIRSKAKKLAAE